uniref:Uncharacterized protein n=1 Tax=Chryseobacterium endophyticum TaxID=1854762 RepID=A0AAU6WQH1_9FLAO
MDLVITIKENKVDCHFDAIIPAKKNKPLEREKEKITNVFIFANKKAFFT